MTGWTSDEFAELGGVEATELARRFVVAPASAVLRDSEAVTPTAGTFAVEGDALVFVPRHPFADGTTYAFIDRDDTEAEPVTATRQATTHDPSTTVVDLRPAVEEVPLNLLRCYVTFSAPMSKGFAARAVRLRDADSGAELEGALLHMTPELWDPSRTRLTVLLDPGRIKRGLVPNTEAGYPLVEGRTIALVVDADFPDAAGVPLVAPAERRFRVGPPIRSRVDPHRWAVEAGRPSSRDPLLARFDRPLDHALALRCITVTDEYGREVPGAKHLADDAQAWAFTPDEPWAPGVHQLVVAPTLEDLAGNSVTRVFDRDLSDPAHELGPAEDVSIHVHV